MALGLSKRESSTNDSLLLSDAVPGRAALDRYHPLHATRAELLRRTGDLVAADAAYDRALALVSNPAERRYLEERRAGLTPRSRRD